DLIYQIGALRTFAHLEGVPLQHVKPHGALYNMAHRDKQIAQAVVDAVYDIDPALILFTLPQGELRSVAEEKGLRTAVEFFADRTYQNDGTLTPRSWPNALVHDPAIAATRVVRMLTEGKVTAATGEELDMRAQTVCIHGDEPTAGTFAREIRSQ
ncbi:LamB/YcsF family protein, partial [Frankia sp. Cpl3]|nr:LamB/YcsF family protein [Frankia sp. Cpl3]